MARLEGHGLYVLTDCQRLDERELLERTGRILAAGIAALQYRDKSPGPQRRRALASRLLGLCREHDTPLIVNDDAALAAEVGAAGVHLGRGDLDCGQARRLLGGQAVIGVSCYNSLERAREARDQGVDYVAFGAFFASDSKDATVPATPGLLQLARRELDLPIVAIGGITPANCGPLIKAGADFLAVITSVYSAPDPVAAVRQFNQAFQPRT